MVSGAGGGLSGLLAEVRSAQAKVPSLELVVAEALRVAGLAAEKAAEKAAAVEVVEAAGAVWDHFVSTLGDRAAALEAMVAGGSQDRVEGIAQDLRNLWLTYDQARYQLSGLGAAMPEVAVMPEVSVLLGRSVPPVGESVDGPMASRGGSSVEAASSPYSGIGWFVLPPAPRRIRWPPRWGGGTGRSSIR
jgi:hypothetical protein